MHPSTPSQQARCSHRLTSTTSETSDTDTPRSSTVRQTHRHANCLVHPTTARETIRGRIRHLASPRWRRSGPAGRKKMSTGPSGIRRRRTGWGVDVAATPTSPKWRTRKARASRSGWKLLEASLRLPGIEGDGCDDIGFGCSSICFWSDLIVCRSAWIRRSYGEMKVGGRARMAGVHITHACILHRP